MSFNSQNAAIVNLVGSLIEPFMEKLMENVDKDDKDFVIKENKEKAPQKTETTETKEKEPETKETTETKDKTETTEKTETKNKSETTEKTEPEYSSESSYDSESECDSECSEESECSEYSDSESDVSESEYSESECAYVLMVNNLPKACSTNYTDLSSRREDLIKRHTTDFSPIFGRMYVSGTTPEEGKHDTRILSYLNRNLLWTTETVLNTYTIHRVYSA